MPAAPRKSLKSNTKAKLSASQAETKHEPRLTRGRTRAGAIFPVAPPALSVPKGYASTLQEIKIHLKNSRIRAVLTGGGSARIRARD